MIHQFCTMDIYEESIAFHKKNKGKIAITSKVPLNDRHDLSLAYTPGVAGASSEIAKNPEAVWELTSRGNLVAVITDGSAVLGLGNIGPRAALPVMEGKCVLFKKFAGIDAFPIVLKTQDVDTFVNTVKELSFSFGAINLEDISAPRCFEIEERLKAELDIPVMHDDQHGTAIVVSAGLTNAFKITGSSFGKAKILINGAGAAGVAILKMLVSLGAKDILIAHGSSVSASDMRGMRERIQRELSKETAGRDRLATSYDIKLGYGGLEELEFTVQYLQLKNCAEHNSLLVQNTLDAVKRLCLAGIINKQHEKAMNEAYIFYRTLESYLRLRERDILKKGDEDILSAASEFLGFKGKDEFMQCLEGTRKGVRDVYDIYV